MRISLNSNDDGCIDGSSVWVGKYKLEKNIITMNYFKIDKTNSYKPTSKLVGPTKKLIVNFDDMYLCNRDAGLDCDKKYEKDTNE